MTRRLLILLCAVALPTAGFASQETLTSRADGVPTFVRGELGQLNIEPTSPEKAGDAIAAAAAAWLGDFALANFQAHGDEKLVATAINEDDLGKLHVRFVQEINGLSVDGAGLVVHADATTGEVYAVNGDFVPNRFLAKAATVEGLRSIGETLRAQGIRGSIETAPALAYIFDQGETTLAWKALVSYRGTEGQPARDWVYVDATSGSFVTVLPTIHHAKSWRSYSANNGTSLPGTLRCTGTQTCGDSAVQAAHTGASQTYDYYMAKFGRDSLNGSGLTLTSTARYGNNYNNAFWNGSQMVYGDGDGTTFIPLSNSLDVVAHELTHGVTEYESNLVYNREPGALNEALSDIFGAAVEAYVDGSVNSNTWKLGEDIYTPGTSGDALRYMDNPTLDGYSPDYYPERLYAGSCSPTQNNDYCGVHGNSGIANIAFKLLVTGGVHPRNKTTINVPGIGMAKAEQIFYRAQVNYLTSSSNFENTRNYTAQAAADLYGASSAEVNSVHQAWCAVGVPGCPTGGGGGGSTELANGVARTNLSGSTGSLTYYTVEIPSGATNLSIAMSGGSGDADLYVRFGSQPTTSTYNCRPYLNGNNETCSFATPQVGTYHVMVRGYSAYSGVSLVATWTTGGGGGGGCTLTTSSVPNLSGSQSSTRNYTVTVPSGCGNLTVATAGGTGDADLYVRRGAAPTTSTYDCRPYKNGNNETCSFNNPQAATWYIMIRGYRAYSGLTLSTSYAP